MTRQSSSVGFAFSIGLVAALFALSLRLMAPAGWMPVAAGNTIVLTLCSGNEQQIVIGKDGKPAPDTGAAHQGLCAFSGNGTPALPDVQPAVTRAVPAIFIALIVAASPALLLPAIGWLRPPLRGPPLRA